MARAYVGVVLGSRADFNIMKRGLEALRVMGVPYVFELASVHRGLDRLNRFAREAEGKGLDVLICAAGGSAAVATVLASQTCLPVIAVPIDSTPLRGEDALFSMVQTPPGIPVATVGINNSENAALLAAQILAIKHTRFREVLLHRRQQLNLKLDSSYKELLADYPDLCDPSKTVPNYTARESDVETDPGPEDVTPDPVQQRERPSGDAIRPGAHLSRKAPAPAAYLGRFVDTPMPQEPGTVTEDASLLDDVGTLPPRDDLPAPNYSDLYPDVGPTDPLPPLDESPKPRHPRNGERGGAPPALPPMEANEEYVPDEPDHVDTQVFEISPVDPDEDVLSHAMMVLLEGGIVALPTDTVYGLAVDATNPDAVRRLYEVKGHTAQHKSLSVLIENSDDLDALVREVPPAIESVLDRFWPGGLTVLFYKHPSVLAAVTDSNSIAIRIPDNPVALALMRMVQRPLAVINASVGSAPAPVDAGDVIDRFGGRVDCVLDAGTCPAGNTSTVLSVIAEPFEIIREGAVAAAELRQILGRKLKN